MESAQAQSVCVHCSGRVDLGGCVNTFMFRCSSFNCGCRRKSGLLPKTQNTCAQAFSYLLDAASKHRPQECHNASFLASTTTAIEHHVWDVGLGCLRVRVGLALCTLSRHVVSSYELRQSFTELLVVVAFLQLRRSVLVNPQHVWQAISSRCGRETADGGRSDLKRELFGPVG